MPETQDDNSYDDWEPNNSKSYWKNSKTIYKYKSYKLILKKHGAHKDESWGIISNDEILGMLNVRYIITLPNGVDIPQVSKSIVDSDFRHKGWGYKMYKGALKYYGLLGSDFHLHGNIENKTGSVGMWLKITSLYPSLVYNDDTEKLYKYSKRTAFTLDKDGERSIISFRSKKNMEKIFQECMNLKRR